MTSLPFPFRHLRHELLDALGREAERLSLLGALVGGHEHLHNLDAVIERESRFFLAEKDPREMAVLGLVAVRDGLVGHDWHQPHFGILLLDEIFSGLSLYLAAEEELQTHVERVPGERIFRAEQLRREAQAGADKAPRRRRLA